MKLLRELLTEEKTSPAPGAPEKLSREHQATVKAAVVPVVEEWVGQRATNIKWHRNQYDEWTLMMDFRRNPNIDAPESRKLNRKLKAVRLTRLYDAAQLKFLGADSYRKRARVTFNRVWEK